MKYQSLHRGLSKISFLRIPLILLILFGGTGLGTYLLFPVFLPLDYAFLITLCVSVIASLKASSSLKGVPAEHLHFEGTDMHWSIEQDGELRTERISLIGLKVKSRSLDYINIETAEGRVLTLHQNWLIVENNTSDASFCTLILQEDGAAMHGFRTFGKHTSSVGNIEEINLENAENSDTLES